MKRRRTEGNRGQSCDPAISEKKKAAGYLGRRLIRKRPCKQLHPVANELLSTDYRGTASIYQGQHEPDDHKAEQSAVYDRSRRSSGADQWDEQRDDFGTEIVCDKEHEHQRYGGAISHKNEHPQKAEDQPPQRRLCKKPEHGQCRVRGIRTERYPIGNRHRFVAISQDRRSRFPSTRRSSNSI